MMRMLEDAQEDDDHNMLEAQQVPSQMRSSLGASAFLCARMWDEKLESMRI